MPGHAFRCTEHPHNGAQELKKELCDTYEEVDEAEPGLDDDAGGFPFDALRFEIFGLEVNHAEFSSFAEGLMLALRSSPGAPSRRHKAYRRCSRRATCKQTSHRTSPNRSR